MRLHAIPYSTNVARVTIALGLKGRVPDVVVQYAPDDRTALIALSGQPLVPVLETDDGQVLIDSMPIVAWIDRTWRQPHPLYPADPVQRREVEGFITFFLPVPALRPVQRPGRRRPVPRRAARAPRAGPRRAPRPRGVDRPHGRGYPGLRNAPRPGRTWTGEFLRSLQEGGRQSILRTYSHVHLLPEAQSGPLIRRVGLIKGATCYAQVEPDAPGGRPRRPDRPPRSSSSGGAAPAPPNRSTCHHAVPRAS